MRDTPKSDSALMTRAGYNVRRQPKYSTLLAQILCTHCYAFGHSIQQFGYTSYSGMRGPWSERHFERQWWMIASQMSKQPLQKTRFLFIAEDRLSAKPADNRVGPESSPGKAGPDLRIPKVDEQECGPKLPREGGETIIRRVQALVVRNHTRILAPNVMDPVPTVSPGVKHFNELERSRESLERVRAI